MDTVRADSTHGDVGSRVRHADTVQQFAVGGVAPNTNVESGMRSADAVQHVAVAVGGAGADDGPCVQTADALCCRAGV